MLKRHSANRIFPEHLARAANRSTLLFRPLHRLDLERAECLAGAIYIYSQWEGYWERGSFDNVKEWLLKHAIPRHSVHTSGHAGPADLKRFVAALNPRKVVPIHSFFPDKYPELFPNVEAHHDGEWWEV
jgi:ribonuclease J